MTRSTMANMPWPAWSLVAINTSIGAATAAASSTFSELDGCSSIAARAVPLRVGGTRILSEHWGSVYV